LAGERPRGFRTKFSRTASNAFGRVANPGFLAAVAAPAGVAALTLFFVIPTLGPGVANWDTAEFQTVGPVLGTAHATGYPSYVILGWLASILLQPFGDPAYRMNLLQALFAATAAAGVAGIIQILTGRRLIALAIGLALFVLPTQLSTGLVPTSPVFWRLSTHADPHMFHVALMAIVFVLVLVWDKRRNSDDEGAVSHADRWLVAATGVYGVAVTNHSLALLVAPAVAVFVLISDWRVILRWRTVVACFVALLGTMAILFAELPIRAAMHAPLVYGHPDNVSGFLYVVMGQQFTGSLQDPFGDLPLKAGHVIDLFAGWMGPLGQLAFIGFGTSLIYRPRYVILTGLAALATCVFSASYANADIERYYLVPLLIAFTWAGLAIADLLGLVGWIVDEIELKLPAKAAASADLAIADLLGLAGWIVNEIELKLPAKAPAKADATASAADTAAADKPEAPAEPITRRPLFESGWSSRAVLIGEIAIALTLIYSVAAIVPTRQLPANSVVGAVSEAGNTGDEAWVRKILMPANQGGLPKNSVIMAWWSDSTRLWYGQKVLGLRPDIYIIDDRTRLDANLGEVQDVFNKYLGNRPVFAIRLTGGIDGLTELGNEYETTTTTLGSGETITQVIRRKGSQ
jgi:hypothetical protein